MKRRLFLSLAAAAALPLPALAADPLEYAPGLVEHRLNMGKTVFLDFKASWCSTCRAQEAVLRELRAENAAYAENIVFVDVDWDRHRDADITRNLNIPRRSTLVALKGDTEIGRIVAGTSKAQIKELLDATLVAAKVD